MQREIARTVEENSVVKRRLSWWLWPNLLSLDAPLVAVVWAFFIARTVGGEVPFRVFLGLAFAVWVIYSVDRLLDAARIQLGHEAAPRHEFHRRHARQLRVLTAVVILLAPLLCLSATLQTVNLSSLLLILPGVGLYLWGVHGSRGGLPLKELACGYLFAWGTALPVSGLLSGADWIVVVLLMGTLFSLNCVCISCWEQTLDRHHDPGSLSVRDPQFPKKLPLCFGIALAVSGLVFLTSLPPAMPIAVILAIVGLGLVHVFGEQMPENLPRVLADVVLLTPLLFLVK